MALSTKWFGFGLNSDYDEGVRAMAASRWGDAVLYFEQAQNSLKDSGHHQLSENYLVSCLMLFAKSLFEKGDFRSALEHTGRAITLRPRYADLRVLHGRAHLGLDDYDAALHSFNEAIHISPSFAQAHLWRAACLIHQKDPDSVIAIKRAQALKPELVKLVQDTVAARKKERTVNLLEDTIRDVLADYPTGPQDLIANGNALATQGKFRDAIACYEQVLALAPRYADVHCSLGQCLLEVDEVERALNCFEEALTINPRYLEAHVQKGITLRRLRRDQEATTCFRAAAEINPNHPFVALELGRR